MFTSNGLAVGFANNSLKTAKSLLDNLLTALEAATGCHSGSELGVGQF